VLLPLVGVDGGHGDGSCSDDVPSEQVTAVVMSHISKQKKMNKIKNETHEMYVVNK
jgi:hypothetical protein